MKEQTVEDSTQTMTPFYRWMDVLSELISNFDMWFDTTEPKFAIFRGTLHILQ